MPLQPERSRGGAAAARGGVSTGVERWFADPDDRVGDQIPELLVVQVHSHGGVAVLRRRGAEVSDGHAEGELALQLDVHGDLAGGHDGGVDHVGNGARIMNRREVEALGVLVRLLEEVHEFHDELGRLGADFGYFPDDFIRGQSLVREVQAHHHHGPLLVEDDVRGFGVDDDVELGHGAPVAHVVAAAHEDNFLHTLNDARLLAGCHGDVGEARCGDQGDRARLMCHDGFNDEVDGVARVQLDSGLGLLRAVHPGITVDAGGCFDGADQGAIATCGEGNTGDAGNRGH